MTALTLVLMLVATAGRCEEVPHDLPLSADEAGLYEQVGAEELAAGRYASAKAAYREALRRDPHRPGAVRGLARACELELTEEERDAALEAIRKGDHATAAAHLARLHARRPTSELSMLEGLARLGLGELESAERRFREAAKDPALRELAHLHLALLAERRGAVDDARALLDSASRARDPLVRRLSSELLRSSAHQSWLELTTLVDVEYDSNVALSPGEAVAGVSVPLADASGGVLVRGAVSPAGDAWPRVSVLASVRKQLTLSHFDQLGVSPSASWRRRFGPVQGRVDYWFLYSTLGNVPLLLGHEARAALRYAMRARQTLGLEYDLTSERYLDEALAAYGATRHALTSSLVIGLSGALLFEARYHVARAVGGALAHAEQGAEVGLSFIWTERWELGLEAAATDRRYESLRIDRYLEGALGLSASLDPRWTAVLQLKGRSAWSSEESRTFQRWLGSLGLAYAISL